MRSQADLSGRDALGLEQRCGRVLHVELAKASSSSSGSSSPAAASNIVGEVVADVDQQAAERGGDAGVGRHEHLGIDELAGEVDAVQRAGAAEGDERELARS